MPIAGAAFELGSPENPVMGVDPNNQSDFQRKLRLVFMIVLFKLKVRSHITWQRASGGRPRDSRAAWGHHEGGMACGGHGKDGSHSAPTPQSALSLTL